jgi:hypothetical protein
VADEFDTLVQQIIMDDSQAAPALARFVESLGMAYQKIDGLNALVTVVSKQMGISFDLAKLKLTELNNAFLGSNVDAMSGGGMGSFAFDPTLFDRVTQSAGPATEAYKKNATALGGLVDTMPNAAAEIKQLGDNLVNTANKGKQVPPVLADTGQKATGLVGVLDRLGKVFYHVWTAMLAFQVIQWAMNLVNGIGAATDAAQAFYKSLVNIEMGIRAMRGAGIDVTMKDATKTISEFTTMFPVISKPAMTDALDNIILKTAKMGLSWKQVTDILQVAAGVYAVTGKSMENTSDAIVNAMVSSSGNMTKSLLEATNLQINSQMIEAKARELNIKSIENGVQALNAEERARTVLAVVMDQYLTKQDDISTSMETAPAKVEAVNQAFETWKTNVGLLFLEIKANFAPEILYLIGLLEWLTDVAKNTFIFQKTAGESAMSAITKIESARSGFTPEELLRMNPRYSEYKDIDKTTEAWRQYTAALEKATAIGNLMRMVGKLPNQIVAEQMKIMSSEGGEYGRLYAQEFTKAFAETIANEGYESAFDSGETLGEGIISGMSESDRASLDTAKATAEKILSIKMVGFTEEQEAELKIAQETAEEILAIKDRALTEEEQTRLDKSKKTTDDIIKDWKKALSGQIMSETDWKEQFSGLETGAERANMVMSLLKAGLEGLGPAGALVWDSLLQGMGKLSPAAIEVYTAVQTLLYNINRAVENNVAPNITAGWAQAWVEQIQNLANGGGEQDDWIDVPGGSWQENKITGGWRNLETGTNVQYWADRGYGTPTKVDLSKMGESMDALITKNGDLTLSQKDFIDKYIQDTTTFVGQTKLRIEAEKVYKAIYDSYISKVITITTLHKDVYGLSGAGKNPALGTVTTVEAASGIDFIVPPGFENDSFPMRVQSGEHVTVTPAGLSRAMVYNSGHGGITTPSQVGGSGGDISIVVNNPTPRAAPDSISRELISLNYLGITK